MKTYSYFGGLMHGIGSLLTGMKTTMTVFCRRKVTEQYPGESCDTGDVRPFPRYADHAAQ